MDSTIIPFQFLNLQLEVRNLVYEFAREDAPDRIASDKPTYGYSIIHHVPVYGREPISKVCRMKKETSRMRAKILKKD